MTPLNFALPPDTLDMVLRLVAATLIGMFLGLERDLKGKPTGMRTLGLVSFAAALVTLSTMHTAGIEHHTEALSRVLGGVSQGVLVGVGFLGAGVILRDSKTGTLGNLTTAAAVWATAAMGIAAAVAPLAVVGIGFVILFVLMVGVRWIEKAFNLGDKGEPSPENAQNRIEKDQS